MSVKWKGRSRMSAVEAAPCWVYYLPRLTLARAKVPVVPVRAPCTT